MEVLTKKQQQRNPNTYTFEKKINIHRRSLTAKAVKVTKTQEK